MNQNRASGPGAHTSDGSSVELYKLLAGRGEAEIIHGAVAPDADVLELGAGVGRVTHALLRLGHRVTAIDNSAEMLAEIRGAEIERADIVGLDLKRTFGGVILGSCLVNVVEDDLRREFLRTCARHVSGTGAVLLECHRERADEWARAGSSTTDDSGVRITWLDVVASNGRITGTLEYSYGESTWTQSFSTRILSQGELSRELESVGLTLVRRLSGNWVEARKLAP